MRVAPGPARGALGGRTELVDGWREEAEGLPQGCGESWVQHQVSKLQPLGSSRVSVISTDTGPEGLSSEKQRKPTRALAQSGTCVPFTGPGRSGHQEPLSGGHGDAYKTRGQRPGLGPGAAVGVPAWRRGPEAARRRLCRHPTAQCLPVRSSGDGPSPRVEDLPTELRCCTTV